MVYEIEPAISIDLLYTPALFINLDVLKSNIIHMAEYFKEQEAVIRPHMKTHKYTKIAKMQLAEGAVGITCAKINEAKSLPSPGLKIF